MDITFYETARIYYENKIKSSATMEMRLLHPDSLSYYDKTIKTKISTELETNEPEIQVEEIDARIEMLNLCLTGIDKALDAKIKACVRQLETMKRLKENNHDM